MNTDETVTPREKTSLMLIFFFFFQFLFQFF